MSDQQAAFNSIHKDLDRVISTVEGMILSPAFRDKESLEIALNDLSIARETLVLACTPETNGH